MDVSFNFEHKNFIVTGASSGIAKALVLELAGAKATVLAIARRENELNFLKEKFPEQIFIAAIDVCDEKALENEIKKFVRENGKINGSVHAAGILNFTPLRAFSFDKAKAMMDVNFWAGIKLLEIVTKVKNTCMGSSHVQISSVNSYRGQKGLSVYCSVKAAMRIGIQAFSKELGEKGIRVNTISPGVLHTPMTEGTVPIESLLTEYPLGAGNVLDITNVIMFLLSDGSRWITGTDIVVDGGYLA